MEDAGQQRPLLPSDRRRGESWAALEHFRVDLATLFVFLGRNTT